MRPVVVCSVRGTGGAGFLGRRMRRPYPPRHGHCAGGDTIAWTTGASAPAGRRVRRPYRSVIGIARATVHEHRSRSRTSLCPAATFISMVGDAAPFVAPVHCPQPIQEAPLAVAPEDRVRGTVGLGAVRDTARHPALVYLARLAPGSRRTMEGALATAARALGGDDATILSFPWPALRYQHTAALRAACWDRYTPATTNKLLAAVRGVLREAWRLHLIEAEDYTRAADVRGVRAATLLRGRALSTGEIRSLFAHCAGDPFPAGVRDAALLGVLYGAGLRRAEAVALNVGDYDPETAALRVERGKGRKARVTYVRGGAAAALEEWLALRESPTPTNGSAALFTRLRKGGTVTALRLTDSGVMHVLQHRALAAGVPSFSPHDIRRTFIGDLLDAGADISTVQRLAGTRQRTDDRAVRSTRRTHEACGSGSPARALHAPARLRGGDSARAS